MSLLTRITGAVSTGVEAAVDAWLGGAAPAAESAARHPSSELLAALAQPAPYAERDPAILGNRLTPGLLAAIIAQRNQGYMQPWIDLGGEFLQKNPHLGAQLLVRRDSVVETTFLVRPGKGSNRRAAKKAADACTDLLEDWQARTDHSWADLAAQLTGAVWWQRSCHEVMWARDGREVRIDHCEPVHPRRLSYAAPYGDPEPWAIRLHDPDDPLSPFCGPYGTPLTAFHPDKFLVHLASPLGLQPTCDGLFAAAVWYLLFYEWSWRDLMALIELLGRPSHIGYYSAQGAKAAAPLPGAPKMDGGRFASPEEIAHLKSAVNRVSGSLREVLSDTTRIEPLRYDQRNTPLQREALEHLERLLSKLINGSTGVTDIVAGARAAHETAYRQSFTFWRSDVRRVCSAITWLFGRYIDANPGMFSAGAPRPVLWSPDVATAREGTKNDNAKGDPADSQEAA